MSNHGFTCFPRLPLDLRQNIWRYSCHERRIVDIWTVELGELSMHAMGTPRGPYHACLRHVTICKIPDVLHATEESRRIALTDYTLAFGFSHRLSHGLKLTGAPQSYVNWDSDIICPMSLERQTCLDFFLAVPGLSKIALNISDIDMDLVDLTINSWIKEVILYSNWYPLKNVDFSLWVDRCEVELRDEWKTEEKAWLEEGRAALYRRYEKMERRKKSSDSSLDSRSNPGQELSIQPMEEEELAQKHPRPLVTFKRLFVNGIDIDSETVRRNEERFINEYKKAMEETQT
ncbi:uncharacterized protein LY89DRAFT_670024 [Mollisia scopiformis]|uniref:2EXR domain-containing protein n=1 Tax=Mollisia scopiformis TaxID=149040 RepID=A0A194X8S2_MOLSC|nr:uncharacterized protein LY89DRAFT_670024 [Mollisia scopiformis]KUJ16514.1 hypothetical protein LY89DRAFT_670024 [Mollisia scopiformis]